jgi:hypothetical protein
MPAGAPGLALMECHGGGKGAEKARGSALGTQWRLGCCWRLMHNLLPDLFRQSTRDIIHVLHNMHPYLCSVACFKNWYSIYFYISGFPDIFNAQHTHALNLLKSVTHIIHKEKRIDFMSNMKKCTIG